MRALAIAMLVGVLGCKSPSAHDAGSGGAGGGGGSGGGTGGGVMRDAGASVLQFHHDTAHHGAYVDPALTRAAISTLHQDPSFYLSLNGPVYAQPLFLDHLVGDVDAFLVATEQNVVGLYDADKGTTLWEVSLAPPVPMSTLPCGNVDPLGITGTPIVDLDSRRVYLDAMTTPDNGATKKHKLFALSIDTGAIAPGWPIDVEDAISTHLPKFESTFQNQRGALNFVDGVLYVPYGGHAGDCGTYYGWVIAVDTRNGNAVTAFNTSGRGGGAWSPVGVASDGTSMFVVTGNTFEPPAWSGGNAVIKLGRGATFSGDDAGYFTPYNWLALDVEDWDMGTLLLVDLPGATPSALVAAFGKDGWLNLVDRERMGGVYSQVNALEMTDGEMIGAGCTYPGDGGVWMVMREYGGTGGMNCPNGKQPGNMQAVRLTVGADAGPQLSMGWCTDRTALSNPTASMSAPGQNPIVWTFDTSHLYAYDGETGDELYSGGDGGDAMGPNSYFNAVVIAKGKVYVASHKRLYRFVP